MSGVFLANVSSFGKKTGMVLMLYGWKEVAVCYRLLVRDIMHVVIISS